MWKADPQTQARLWGVNHKPHDERVEDECRELGKLLRERVAELDERQQIDLRPPPRLLLEIVVAENVRFNEVLVWIPALVAVQHDVLRVNDLVARFSQWQWLERRVTNVLEELTYGFFEPVLLCAFVVGMSRADKSHRDRRLEKDAHDFGILKLIAQSLPRAEIPAVREVRQIRTRLEVADQPVKIEPQHLAGKTRADVVDAKTEIALILLRLFRRQCPIIQHDANTIAGRRARGQPLAHAEPAMLPRAAGLFADHRQKRAWGSGGMRKERAMS